MSRGRRFWTWGVFAFGIAYVGLTYACLWLVIPDRPLIREWWLGPWLIAPYLLTAVGVWFCRPDARTAFRIVRICSGVVLACGLLSTVAVLADVWPIAIDNEPRPAVFGSAFVSVYLLVFVQYPASFIALFTGHWNR